MALTGLAIFLIYYIIKSTQYSQQNRFLSEDRNARIIFAIKTKSDLVGYHNCLGFNPEHQGGFGGNSGKEI